MKLYFKRVIISLTKSLFVRKFISAGAYGFFGKILTLIFGFFVNALLARLLTPSVLGEYFIAFSIVSVFAIFSQIGMNQSVVKFTAVANGYADISKASAYVREALNISFIVSFVVMVLYWLFIGDWLSLYLFDSLNLSKSSFIIGCWIIVWVVQAIVSESFRGFKDIFKMIVFSGLMFNGILAVLLILGESFIGNLSLLDALTLTVVATGISALIGILILSLRISSGESLNFSDKKEFYKTSAPLLFVGLMNVASLQLDIWVLGVFVSKEDVALYGAALRMVRLVLFSLIIIEVLVPPYIAELYDKGKHEYLNKILQITAAAASIPALIIFIIYMLFGEYLLGFVFGEFYTKASVLLIILSIGQVINVITGAGTSILAMTGHQWGLMKATFVMVFLKITLLPLTAYYFDIMGAAIATSVITIIYNIVIVNECKKSTGITPLASYSKLIASISPKRGSN